MHAAEGPLPAAGDAVRAPRDGTVRGACPHDCPDTCALETRVVAGRATAVSGAADHPFTAGSLCTKVSRYLDRTYAPDRILHPMRRLGGKGPGEMCANPVLPAVANAIFNAVGVRIDDLPITPEKVLRAIKAQGGARPAGRR